MKKLAPSPSWIIVLTLIILACGNATPQPATCTQKTKILQPADGAVIPWAPYSIIVSVTYKDLDIKINGSLVLQNEFNGMPVTWEYTYAWSPPAPGPYLIEARSFGYVCNNGPGTCESCTEGTPWDQVHVTVAGVISQICKASSSANLYCRQGPGTSYASTDTILPGQIMPVAGQSPDGLYLYLIGPDSHLPCAVPANTAYLQLSGDCGALPIFTPGPTPVPPPSDKTNPKPAQCSDGKDNDGDRLIDMSDPQCRNPDDNSESTP
jgi:hypothetical protein